MSPALILNPLKPPGPPVNWKDSKAIVNLAKEYLKTDAFKNYRVTGNKSKTHEVKDIVRRFLRERLSLQVAQSSLGYTTLVETTRTKAIEAQGYMALLNSFVFYPSLPAPLDIRDSAGKFLRARFTVLLSMIEQLQGSTAVLAAASSFKSTEYLCSKIRGFPKARHFIARFNSAPSASMSKEYQRRGERRRPMASGEQTPLARHP
jgi:hypothetical protein